jgi:carbon-monoxide dehydrogenase medium subunit
MKPVSFKYHDPRHLDEVVDLLSTLENAKLLAGGQTLMPMMNFRYLMPDHLIDLNKVEALDFLQVDGDYMSIGAMTRQRTLEFSSDMARHCPILLQALHFVGHRQTRNRGTMGGSLCHFDPAAELVNMTALLDGKLQIDSKKGAREVSIADFNQGFLTTQIAEGELLSRIRLTLPHALDGFAFVEFARRHGDFAIVACSSLMRLNAKGEIESVKIALSGLGAAPIRPHTIEANLLGHVPSNNIFIEAAHAANQIESVSDAYVSAVYRQHLARIMTYRALSQAAKCAQEKLNVR